MPKRAVPIPAGAVWRFVLAAVCTSHAFRHVGGFSPATQTALRVPAARPTLLSPRSDGSSASTVCALLDGSTQRALRCVPLYGKKKKRGGGGAGGAKSSKLQVKLLKYVEGTGSIGDIIFVAPAFYNNKLKPGGAAELISDEEVAAQKKEADIARTKALNAALEVKEHVEGKEIALTVKSGPDGRLFGSVGPKDILSELKGEIPKGALTGKVKIIGVKDEDDQEVPHDIKEIGTYSVRLQLLKDIEANFQVRVEEQRA